MKLGIVDLSRPSVDETFLFRGKEPIRFVAQAVISDSEFEKYCPEPEPRIRRDVKTGQITKLVDDPNYQKQMLDYYEKRTNWMIWNSLLATPDLEWETIDPMKPNTWGNYKDELKKANFTQAEIMRLVNFAAAVNGMSDSRLKEAREAFLSMNVQEESVQSDSQMDGQSFTKSGGLVNESESGHQE